MKRFFICLISFFVIISYFSLVSYGQQDRRQVVQPRGTQGQQPQTQRPILPPIAPQAASSPTPSPHIATPPVSGSIIAQPAMPYGASGVELTQTTTPIFGNAWGKVLDIGYDKDGTSWIELNDELFNSGTVKIKLKDPNITIIKESFAVKFSDIKIGDTVSIVYKQEGEDNIANFIGIIPEEGLEAMSKEMLETDNKKAKE